MHEASIAQSMLEIVIDTAEKNGSAVVSRVFVKIGKLAAIETEPLRFAFDALKEDTIAASAELVVDTVPITGLCQDCGHTDTYDTFIFTCTRCGSHAVSLETGEELQITEIEVD